MKLLELGKELSPVLSNRAFCDDENVPEPALSSTAATGHMKLLST